MQSFRSLFRHFQCKNTAVKLFEDAYEVAFLEEPDFKNLDYKEYFWIDKLKSNINLAKTHYSDL